MRLQDRDYTITLNEEEKIAYEAELVYEAKKGPKNNHGFPSVLSDIYLANYFAILCTL